MGQSVPLTVLLVDDETRLRSMASMVLQEEGFIVFEAATAQEAVRLAEKHEIDVLLTDVNMPGSVDGLGLAAFVRGVHPMARVIFSSGDDISRLGEHADDASFLAKPYLPHQLSRIVRDQRLIG
jgi:DNA-binding NtrC family response regulator